MTEPRRVLIGWDHGAHGIWWEVLYQMDGRMLRVHPAGQLAGRIVEARTAWLPQQVASGTSN